MFFLRTNFLTFTENLNEISMFWGTIVGFRYEGSGWSGSNMNDFRSRSLGPFNSGSEQIRNTALYTIIVFSSTKLKAWNWILFIRWGGGGASWPLHVPLLYVPHRLMNRRVSPPTPTPVMANFNNFRGLPTKRGIQGKVKLWVSCCLL